VSGLTEEQRLALTLVQSDGSPGDVPDGYAEFMQKGWEMPNENDAAIEQLGDVPAPLTGHSCSEWAGFGGCPRARAPIAVDG
jgi:hypothetical protein